MKERRRALVVLAALGVWVFPAVGRAACRVDRSDFDGNGREDLRIVGDARPQAIHVFDGQTAYRVQIDCNNDGDFTDPGDIDTGIVSADIETYEINGGGSDVMTFEAGFWDVASKNVAVTFGPSPAGRASQLLLDLRRDIAGSSLVVDVLGSAAADEVAAYLGRATDSSYVLRGDLGAGDDTLSLYSFPTLLRTVLTVDVSMGVGNNSIFLPAKWSLDASTMSVAVQGGPLASQKDRLEWNANGALVNGSRYLTTASLLGGNDSLSGIVGIVQPLSIDAGSLVDLRVDAGAGDDSLALRDTSAGFTPAANLVAGVFGASLVGGAGKDVVRIDLDGGVAGAGATRLALDAGAGDDVAIASLRLDASAGTPRFDVAVYGGAGADVLYVASLPDGGPADPVMPLLDGGAGLDACIFSDFTRQVAHLVLDCEMSGY